MVLGWLFDFLKVDWHKIGLRWISPYLHMRGAPSKKQNFSRFHQTSPYCCDITIYTTREREIFTWHKNDITTTRKSKSVCVHVMSSRVGHNDSKSCDDESRFFLGFLSVGVCRGAFLRQRCLNFGCLNQHHKKRLFFPPPTLYSGHPCDRFSKSWTRFAQ